VAENWRVRVILAGRGATKFRQSFRVVLLESGLGDDTTISDDYKSSVFIYTTTSEAAEKAEHLALQALAQRERRGDCRLEQWDSLLKEWRDVRSGQRQRRKQPRGQPPLTRWLAALSIPWSARLSRPSLEGPELLMS